MRSCVTYELNRRQHQQGFTLIELLVVLLIIGLISGLVIPRLSSVFSSTRLTYERDDILESIASLGTQALNTRQRLVIGAADAALPFELPADWRLQVERPIIYQPNGTCLGGKLFLSNTKQTYQVVLNPPFCKPDMSS